MHARRKLFGIKCDLDSATRTIRKTGRCSIECAGGVVGYLIKIGHYTIRTCVSRKKTALPGWSVTGRAIYLYGSSSMPWVRQSSTNMLE
jgi:hypothetical protein